MKNNEFKTLDCGQNGIERLKLFAGCTSVAFVYALRISSPFIVLLLILKLIG